MPYVDRDIRAELVDFPARSVVTVNVGNIRTAGDLNFVITTIVADYFSCTERRYKDINDIIGALECAKQEFYRRIVSPYEDKKMKENGDVY